jgi:hypothetical protein
VADTPESGRPDVGLDGERLIARLPAVRGRLQPNFSLGDITWFRTGGPAEALFAPADEDDLASVWPRLRPTFRSP